MSNVGVALPSDGLISPESLIGEHNKHLTHTTVRQIREVLPVQHWNFVNCLDQILPFALEAISPKDSNCVATIPKLNSPNDVYRPKQSLSAGLSVNLYRRLIVENQVLSIPMIAFNKYSHTASNHEIKKVELKEILADFRFWTQSVGMKHGETVDFENVIELSLRIFLEGGFAIYSAVSFSAAQKDYYRISLICGDMFVEVNILLDDYITYKRMSRSEFVTRVS